MMEPRMDREPVGRLIAAIRRRAGLTQAELAALIGVSQPAMAQFEREDSNLTIATLQKIATALDLMLSVSFY